MLIRVSYRFIEAEVISISTGCNSSSAPTVVDPEPVTAPYIQYDEYCDMTGEQQKEFYDSFESPEEFFAWPEQAKAEYGNSRNYIIFDGGTMLNQVNRIFIPPDIFRGPFCTFMMIHIKA